MPMPALPPGMTPGAILKHARFYPDPESGEMLPKYLLVLAPQTGGDIVFRLLTSKPHGRQESPACNHSPPYPSFYLGVLGGALGSQSWLDLRGIEDYEAGAFSKHLKQGLMTPNMVLSKPLLCAALACAAAADDTTQAQERALRDQRSALNC